MNEPWKDEPDEELFTSSGLPCMIRRHPVLGHLNGYVGVPKEHPWFGRSYDGLDLNCHGGLTFAGDDLIPPLPEGFWWFGFDCSHAYDLVPGLLKIQQETQVRFIERNDVYRDIGYVRLECQELARKIAMVEEAHDL